MKAHVFALRLAALWLALLSATVLHGQTDKKAVLQGAVDEGRKEALARMDPGTMVSGTNQTVDQFFAQKGIEVPILLDRLETPMKRYAQKIIMGTWTFYASDWWQWTIRSLLVLAALLGIFKRVLDVSNGNANPATTWRDILFRFGITAAIIASIAPNAPFVLTRAINSMSTALQLTAADASIVRYHEQAFYRRCIEIEARAAQVLNGRFTNQFYNSDSLVFPHAYESTRNLPVPDYISPLSKTPDNKGPYREVTALSFLFVSPPMLGHNYQQEIGKTGTYYLLAPPATGDPTTIVRTSEAFRAIIAGRDMSDQAGELGSLLGPLDTSSSDIVLLADPISPDKKVTVPRRPFGAAVAKGLEVYNSVHSQWATLRQGKKHNQALDAADMVAKAIYAVATEALAEDMVANQAFALTPPVLPANRVTNSDALTRNAFMGSPIAAQAQAIQALEQAAASEQIQDIEKRQASFRIFYERIGEHLSRDFDQIESSQVNEWTYGKIIPVGLLICNAYIIVMIWILPPLLGIWGVFFLLPEFFDLSMALKRGGAGIIALLLYPILLQLILVFCFAFADAFAALDNEMDGDRNWAKMAIYGIMPSSATFGSAQVLAASGKTVAVNSLAQAIDASNAGIGTMISWLIILIVLIGSPAIIAKFIMGMGAADAIQQPVQSGATMGTMMAVRAVGSGAASGASDIAAAGSALSSSVSRHLPRR